MNTSNTNDESNDSFKDMFANEQVKNHMLYLITIMKMNTCLRRKITKI